MASDDGGKEESKDANKNEKKFPNKNILHPSKVKNKQKQKEAIKKNKIKRTKGTSKLASDATAAQVNAAEWSSSQQPDRILCSLPSARLPTCPLN